MDDKNILEPRTWEEFRDSGFFFFTNYILQFFGWSLIMEKEDGKITKCYPARTHHRGFSDDAIQSNNVKMIRFIDQNAPELFIDCLDNGNNVFQKWKKIFEK